MTKEMSIGEITDRNRAKKICKKVARQQESVISNGRELLPGGVSRSMARKYAYRWRGSRRGRYWSQLLAKTNGARTYSIEEPIEYVIPAK